MKEMVGTMAKFQKEEYSKGHKPHKFTVIEYVLKAKSTSVKNSHFWIIAVLLAALSYIYYGVLTDHYNVYLMLFFYPLIYAAVIYRIRGVIVCGLVSFGILLPQTLLFSYDAYSLLSWFLFAIFAFVISALIATLLNYLEWQIEARDEILSLMGDLNDYIKRLESTQKQLIQAEKLSALGKLSAAIAHEINNPLAGVLVYVKLLTKKMGSGSFEREGVITDLSKIEAAVRHCSRLVRGLLDFARQSEPVLKPVEVETVVNQVIYLVSHQAEMKGIEVITKTDPSVPPVMADASQIQQVLTNLTVNAIQATPKGGKLVIHTSSGDDGYVQVSVQDTGCGIPPENMDKLFTPFFTTKDVKGVGLGLSVSYGIIERHGGKIDVQSEVGVGSKFTVHLPVAKKD